jgi:MoaA/NifB/PqqE/SkfB family radical SAM enzyme
MDGLSRAWSSARFAFDFAVVRRDRPFVLGLAVTDRCNLRCRHCRVWSAHAPHMPLAQIAATLRRFHDRGARLLYLEGGEPFLWRDGELRLADVVGLARRLGYLRVHIYSNGTLPLDAPADFVWVSADGLHETNFALRGSNLDQVLDHARDCATKKAMLFTVNSVNHQDILPFLELVREALPGVPVMFNLHTPYYGQDELLLDEQTRNLVLDTLADCKRVGLPVMNSLPALERLRPGRGSGPRGLWYVVDGSGEYRCCRALGDPAVCNHCGYAACEEILLLRNFNPRALASMIGCL